MNRVINNHKYLACWELIQNAQSLSLATLTEQGFPECSYTPYLFQQERGFFILISGLSSHSSNLRINPKAGVLITQSNIKQAFAQPRVMLSCQAHPVVRYSECYVAVIESMQMRFGETVNILAQLTDFSLWQLQPFSGRWISGFGKAVQLGEDSGLLMAQVSVKPV